MNFYFSSTFRALSVAILLLLPAFLSAWPTSFLMRGSRLGYGRNIRPLHCKAKGEAGICMFAWDCMKASGTHLGTCVDRFYFGSCCKLKSTTGPNEIPLAIDEDETESDIYDSDLKPSVDLTPMDIFNIITEESTVINASEDSSSKIPETMTSTNEIGGESVVPSTSESGSESTSGDVDSENASPDSPVIDESNQTLSSGSEPTESGHIVLPDGGTLITTPEVSNAVDIFSSSSGSEQATGSETLQPSIPEEPSSTVVESESPSSTIEELEFPPYPSEELEPYPSPIEETESPSNDAEEAESPSVVAEESESPSVVAEESESPSVVAEESESPSSVAEESESQSVVAEESESPAGVVEESESPSAVAEEDESPSAVIEEAESTSAVAEESESLPGVVEESELPSTFPEESEPSSTVVEEAESPEATIEETESHPSTPEESETISSIAEESQSPIPTAGEPELPPPATAEESSASTTEDSDSYPVAIPESSSPTSAAEESENQTSNTEESESSTSAVESESAISTAEESESHSSIAEESEQSTSTTEESDSTLVTDEEPKPSSTTADESESSPTSEGSDSTLSSIETDSMSSSLDSESNSSSQGIDTTSSHLGIDSTPSSSASVSDIQTETSTSVSSSNTESPVDVSESSQATGTLDGESSTISGTPSTIDLEVVFDGDSDNVTGTASTDKPDVTKLPENAMTDATVDPSSDFSIIPIADSDNHISDGENIPNTSGTVATDEAPAPTDTLGITDPMGSELENAIVSSSPGVVTMDSGESTTPISSAVETTTSVVMDVDTSSDLSTSENETHNLPAATNSPSFGNESELVDIGSSTVEPSLTVDILPGIQIVIDSDSQTDVNAIQPLVPIIIDANNQTGEMEILFPGAEHTTEKFSEETTLESVHDTDEPETDETSASTNLTESSSINETTDKTVIETEESENVTEPEKETEPEIETEEPEKEATIPSAATTESLVPTGDKEGVTVILDGESVTKPSTDDNMVTLVFPEEETDDKIIFTTTSPITQLVNSNITYEEQEDMIVQALKTANYQDICGVPVYPSSRIVGGAEASYGQWPWQVSLRQWRSVAFLHKCGAALVNENWAITAAHCVEGIEPDQLLLVMGEYDLGTPKEPYTHVEKSVQVIAMHPKFEPRTFEFDLALLRFAEPIEFQPNIIPICIPTDDYDFLNHTGYVTGWGRLYEDGPLPTVMQKVAVPIIPNNECEDMYKEAGYIEHIPKIFICAGFQAGKQDSCEGDSGGPLVIQHKDRWNLAGVISWGIGCAVPNQPGVYTRISEFREWINKIIIF